MKGSFVGLVLATVIAFSFGASVPCEPGDIGNSQKGYPTANPWGHNGPGPGVNSGSRHWPKEQALQGVRPSAVPCFGPIPQKVKECPAPPPDCGPKLVPLYFRDPGPVKPVIQHIVGLAGATVALPFRMAETLCPLPQYTWGPTIMPSCQPIPCVPPTLSLCAPTPPPSCSVAPTCFPPLVCRPVGPCVAPLPPAPCRPPCGPNLPPALVGEYWFPQYEAQDLLSGIWNFPGRLIRMGRFAGDIHKTSPCAPPQGW
jgi:hypothetical protein